MKPRRVVEQHPHSLEAQLLRAGQAVKAPDSTLRLTMSAIGLGAAATTAASVGGAVHGKAWGLFGSVSAKWTAIAVLAGSGTYAAARIPGWLRAPATASVESTPTQSVAPLPPSDVSKHPLGARAAVTASKTAWPTESRVASTLAQQNAPVRSGAKAVLQAAPIDSSQSVATTGDSLGAEVALIDAARLAVDIKQGGRALALLQQHDRQFTSPRLAQEAALLRERALEQLGRANEAKAAPEARRDAYSQNPLVEP